MPSFVQIPTCLKRSLFCCVRICFRCSPSIEFYLLFAVFLDCEVGTLCTGKNRCGSCADVVVVGWLQIHNIAFQGWLSPNYLDLMGLQRARVYTPEALLDDTRPGFSGSQADINLLKGGIVYADRVTTVSGTYAKEVFQPEFGMGLQGVLARHAGKFSGVLNGIDPDMWNPATDPLLPAHYTAADPAGKAACKQALLAELGLPPQENTPLVAVRTPAAGCCISASSPVLVVRHAYGRFRLLAANLLSLLKIARLANATDSHNTGGRELFGGNDFPTTRDATPNDVNFLLPKECLLPAKLANICQQTFSLGS
jgi:hypothetical protein